MLTGRPVRRAVGGLLVLTAAGAGPVLATGQPALADSVRSAQQWVLDAVDAPAAWPVTQGSGVLVAVIDSGVRPDVSDLTGSVTSGPDLSGVGTPASDAHWGMHGTWMASLIAGHGHGPGGSDGISGVAPQAKILSIRVLPDKKDPGYRQYKHESSSRGQHALAQAIRYAVAHHANVISMSLGYGASSRAVRAALQDATRHGVVVVASSGNSGTSADGDGKAQAPYMFPADYPGVLGVAAVDRSGGPAPFSSDNLSVQIAAPGVKVPAQGSDGQYWLVSGTSPACALTAGVAALIKSVYPHLAPGPGHPGHYGQCAEPAEAGVRRPGGLRHAGRCRRADHGRQAHRCRRHRPRHRRALPLRRRAEGDPARPDRAPRLRPADAVRRARGGLPDRVADRGGPADAVPPPGDRGSGRPTARPVLSGRDSARPGVPHCAARFSAARFRPAGPRPACAVYQATQPPAGPATSWWSQDNGTRPPGPAAAPDRGEPDRTVAGPQAPRTEPHPIPLSPLPAQPSADLASTWWSQGNGTRPPGPAPSPRRDQPDRAEPHPSPSSLPPAQPPADLASTWWSQGNGTRPPGPVPSPDQDETDRTVVGPLPPWPQPSRAEPPLAEPPQPEPPQTEPGRAEPQPGPSLPPPAPPSAWPGPSRRAGAPPSPAPAPRAGQFRPGPARAGRSRTG